MTHDGTVTVNWDPSHVKVNYGWVSSKIEIQKKAFGKKKKSLGTCCILWVVETVSGIYLSLHGPLLVSMSYKTFPQAPEGYDTENSLLPAFQLLTYHQLKR